MKLGRLVVTQGVDHLCTVNPAFAGEVEAALGRYVNKDWGDLGPEDKEANEAALRNKDRIFARYNLTKPIYIITEWDRSATTVLFPEEY